MSVKATAHARRLSALRNARIDLISKASGTVYCTRRRTHAIAYLWFKAINDIVSRCSTVKESVTCFVAGEDPQILTYLLLMFAEDESASKKHVR